MTQPKTDTTPGPHDCTNWLFAYANKAGHNDHDRIYLVAIRQQLDAARLMSKAISEFLVQEDEPDCADLQAAHADWVSVGGDND